MFYIRVEEFSISRREFSQRPSEATAKSTERRQRNELTHVRDPSLTAVHHSCTSTSSTKQPTNSSTMRVLFLLAALIAGTNAFGA